LLWDSVPFGMLRGAAALSAAAGCSVDRTAERLCRLLGANRFFHGHQSRRNRTGLPDDTGSVPGCRTQQPCGQGGVCGPLPDPDVRAASVSNRGRVARRLSAIKWLLAVFLLLTVLPGAV